MTPCMRQFRRLFDRKDYLHWSIFRTTLALISENCPSRMMYFQASGCSWKTLSLDYRELTPFRSTYLENGYARIFGELPLQFSNEAPALIWNLSLPAWPQT